MIFHDDTETVRLGELAKSAESIDTEIALLFGTEIAIGRGIDANGVTAEEFRGFDPGEVTGHGIAALRFVGIAQIADPVAHDEDIGHAKVVGAFLHFGEIGLIFGLIAELIVFLVEELIHPLQGMDPADFPSDPGELEVVQFTALESLVQ